MSTIKEILGYSTEELEKLSDSELTSLLLPFFSHCRPEKSLKIEKKSGKSPKKKSAAELMKELGLDDVDLTEEGEE